MSADIASILLHSVIKRAADTDFKSDDWNIGYLRGQIDAMRLFIEPGDPLLTEATQAVDALRDKISK